MSFLSTAMVLFGFFVLGVSALCAFASHRHAAAAESDAHDLRRAIGRIGALEEGLASLSSQHAKLRGKFYATKSAPADDGPIRVLEPPGPTCENWLEAQLTGPRSKAAGCECAYCLRMRAVRAAEKAAILAERNRAKANGSE